MNVKITGCIVDSGRRGWMMFFSYTEDVSQLAYLDRFVSDQLRRVGFPTNRLGSVKTFVKSYHEIKYNLAESRYIPNFDNFDPTQKREVIVMMTSYSEEQVASWDLESVDSEFDKIISHEVRDLERDVGNIS